mmetsp:Transcript_12158/g.22367  ORF Transcript_12158/g.22367 Transcript_12158/m.22367 type:complete len:392 (-) Transcript_12158:96-1271(-)
MASGFSEQARDHLQTEAAAMYRGLGTFTGAHIVPGGLEHFLQWTNVLENLYGNEECVRALLAVDRYRKKGANGIPLREATEKYFDFNHDSVTALTMMFALLPLNCDRITYVWDLDCAGLLIGNYLAFPAMWTPIVLEGGARCGPLQLQWFHGSGELHQAVLASWVGANGQPNRGAFIEQLTAWMRMYCHIFSTSLYSGADVIEAHQHAERCMHTTIFLECVGWTGHFRDLPYPSIDGIPCIRYFLTPVLEIWLAQRLLGVVRTACDLVTREFVDVNDRQECLIVPPGVRSNVPWTDRRSLINTLCSCLVDSEGWMFFLSKELLTPPLDWWTRIANPWFLRLKACRLLRHRIAGNLANGGLPEDAFDSDVSDYQAAVLEDGDASESDAAHFS